MFKVGKDESQIDKHTFSRNICSICVAFFGTISSTWSLFLVPKFQSLPPPPKKKNTQADRTLRGGLREMAESFDLR